MPEAVTFLREILLLLEQEETRAMEVSWPLNLNFKDSEAVVHQITSNTHTQKHTHIFSEYVIRRPE